MTRLEEFSHVLERVEDASGGLAEVLAWAQVSDHALERLAGAITIGLLYAATFDDAVEAIAMLRPSAQRTLAAIRKEEEPCRPSTSARPASSERPVSDRTCPNSET